MITLTTEQAQQIEEALVKIADLRNLGKIQPEVIAFETLYVIRAARAQKQAEQPVSQEYQDHLVNQSFDWAAMAAKHQFMEGYRIGLAEMRKAEQKPVAWLWVSEHGSERLEWEPVEDTSKWKSTPLYAAPQPVKQEPIGAILYALQDSVGRNVSFAKEQK